MYLCTSQSEMSTIMPRESRTPSGTGIYHVMMRGINHQDLFEDEEDYYQFLSSMDHARFQTNEKGVVITNCVYYAYCLMSNHIHLLIRERGETVGDNIKQIASSYVYYYNHKYMRDGHLFKERFRSEPVNDMEYFAILLRYIHQNPVKAHLVNRVGDYGFSSWHEYSRKETPLFSLCDTQTVLRRIPFLSLEEMVNSLVLDDLHCLDIEDCAKMRPSDDQVWNIILTITGVSNMGDFQRLGKPQRDMALIELRRQGASVRQLERLTGVGRGLIQNLSG